MTKNKWKREFNHLLEIFEIESTVSLSKINHYFERLGRPFDDKFREYFLDKSTQRLNTSFDIVQFDGCSKTPILPIQKSSASKEAVCNIGFKHQKKSIANPTPEPENDKSFNDEPIDTDLDIENFVATFVKREFNVGNEVENYPKNISDKTGGKRKVNVTCEKAIDSKNASHEKTNEKNDRTKVSEPLENLWDNLLAQMQQPIDSIVKLFNFKCNECDYITKYKFHLGRHQKIHDFQKLYGIEQDPITKLFKCPHCDIQFIKWYGLKCHLTVSHRGNRPSYKCEHCLRLFDQEIKKDRHEDGCKSRHYECYLCKKYATNYKNDMKEHMRTHSGVKPLQCTVCSMNFRHKKSLRIHLNSNAHYTQFKTKFIQS